MKKFTINLKSLLLLVVMLLVAVVLNGYVYYTTAADNRQEAMDSLGDINFGFFLVTIILTMLTFTSKGKACGGSPP
jgi:hypothetical protein